ASLLSLFLPRLTPTGPSPCRRQLSRRAAAASKPWLLKPMRLITARSPVRRKRRGFGLPGCGRGVTLPTSTRPKPSRSSGPTASAFLSKPAARPIGLAKRRPHSRTARLGSSIAAARGTRPALSRRSTRPWARSGSSRNSSGLSQGKGSSAIPRAVSVERREDVPAVGAQRQVLGAPHGRDREWAVEMREQGAAARGLPLQCRAEGRGIDAQQHEAALTGSMFGDAPGQLVSSREMDEAVTPVVGGALVAASHLGGAPGFPGGAVVDRFSHRCRTLGEPPRPWEAPRPLVLSRSCNVRVTRNRAHPAWP